MKKLLFIFIIYFMLHLQSCAATWVQVGDEVYIDKDSIEYYINDFGETQFDKKIYWMKSINIDNTYQQIEEGIGKKISYILAQRIVDIAQKKVAVKSCVFYDENGNSVFNFTNRDYALNWDTIVPNSNGEFYFELIKNPRYLKRMYKKQQLRINK